jgi:hypothetical protein
MTKSLTSIGTILINDFRQTHNTCLKEENTQPGEKLRRRLSKWPSKLIMSVVAVSIEVAMRLQQAHHVTHQDSRKLYWGDFKVADELFKDFHTKITIVSFTTGGVGTDLIDFILP